MPRGSEKANEFKRYRQVLAALYIGLVTAGFALLAASVVNQLFFYPSAAEPESHSSAPEQFAHCRDRVTSLYDELGTAASMVMALPGERQQTSVLPDWHAFSDAWMKRWNEVTTTCRFSERAADPRTGKAYQRLALVHSGLPTMRQQYQSLLVQFEEKQAADLARMKRDLLQAHALLEPMHATPDEGAR